MNSSLEALILIVDDQPDNLDTIMGYLSESQNHYKFSQAMNGEDAIKVAEKRLPDLIILDWEMPVMNGYDALIALKKNPLTRDIPIVMSTGRSSFDDLDKALNAGAADYIRKPIEKQELLARVRTCLILSRYIKEIKEKNQILEDLNREKDGMIDIVAHDLKSPLNNVDGLITILSIDGLLNDNQKDYIERIKNQLERGKNIINDLLDIHSYDLEDSQINKSKFELNSYLTSLIFNYQREISSKNQQLLTTTDSVSIELISDQDLLGRILDNLLTNAIKFSENDKIITINTWIDENFVKISIQDEGPGISEEDQKKMFKMFQKLSAKPTAGESSNGLGLSIIKTLVNKLGGEIEVKSEIGKGADFIVSIPVQ